MEAEESSFYPGTMVSQASQTVADPSTIKWSAEFERDLENLEHDLAGEIYVKNPKTSKWGWTQAKDAEETLNSQGRRFIIGELRSLIAKNTIFSNVPESRVNPLVRFYAAELITTLRCNYVKYGIKPAYYGMLCKKVAIMVEFAIRRAINSGTMKTLGSSSSEQVVVNRNIGAPRPQGRFSIFGRNIG